MAAAFSFQVLQTPPCRHFHASPAFRKHTTNMNAVVCATGNTNRRRRPSSSPSPPRFSSQDGDDDEGVDLFDISTGWNVEALTSVEAEELLSLEANDDDDNGDDDDWSVVGLSSTTRTTRADEEELDDDIEIAGVTFSTESKKKKASSPPPPPATPVTAEDQLLNSLSLHVRRRLEKLQEEADEEESRLKPNNQRKAQARQKTHRRLKIVAGDAAGIRILSPQGDQTRPMMEVVRGAVFSMIASLHGSPGSMPEGSRWLDLFAGTGAIGIEALSRGCGQAHFVELSPWVTTNCLQPNLEKCGVEGAAVVHTIRAEDFLKKGATIPRFAGGAFDFVSVCPPYEAVSYTELYDLLEESPLIHAQSIVVVEYPKKSVREIRDKIQGLVKMRDRRYGRTLVAIYGPDVDDDGDDV